MTDHTPDVNELARRLKYSARLAGVGKVAAGAAHELNQPLNVIRMAAYNLKRAIEKNTLDPAVALEKLARIDDQIARAARLTGGMKAFSPTASQSKMPIKPSESIGVALELLAKRFSAADAELDYQPTDIMCEVQAVPTALQEVVFNLVENAVDAFMRQGPVVFDITGEGEPAEARVINVIETVQGNSFTLVVSDNAGGIDPVRLALVHAPFVTEADDGSHPGMGLTICHEIAADLGGTLSLDSDSKGITATVSFPIELAPAE
ncbi:ATP-binding protein [Luminiphilus sp.]|nr:ATP-binding protein [Luminiphilus sp.]